MSNTLGIDAGTNSLGWALVNKGEENYELLNRGCVIFQEGVKLDKGVESSKAAERTGYRAQRVRYYRLKLKKLRLLRILIDNGFCPPLTAAELSAWRLKKIYPKTELFMRWQSTDDVEGRNPYYYRHLCLHKKLDFSDVSQKYIFGRALYHIVQRRGFLSNRKDQAGADDGKVRSGISELTQEMNEAGYEYLGDYFYALYNKGEKIRNRYTSRNEHYLKEFDAICEKQCIDVRLADRLRKAIFFQRPLKSQKGQVGRCVFEKNKSRCPSSHPMFEEFRMLSFVNNIKIKTPADTEMRSLNATEREQAISMFFRKSKRDFDFEDIAKKIAGKGKYGYFKDAAERPYLFNYRMDTSVKTCIVTAQLRSIFGEDWVPAVCETYTLAGGKTELQVVNDVWHALFFYSDKEKLAGFARSRLQLNDDEAKQFGEIKVPQDYASLSLKAINKILPYLRRGQVYSDAVFLANLGRVMPSYEWGNKEMREVAIENVVDIMRHYDTQHEAMRLEDKIKEYLKNAYRVSDEQAARLYHPSMIEAYPMVRTDENGLYQLKSPRINSVRNPMAMRSMFQLRKLINKLLADGKINRDTTINIELARELNDANKRKAIADINRINQKERDKAREAVVEAYRSATKQTIEPTDMDILKYLLWEEQDRKCVYTGKEIKISDFIGADPKYDIEHTIPQSVGGDSTRMNLTLCDSRFNRDVKKTHLPSELSNHDEILLRIKDWKEKYESLDKQIRRKKTVNATTKEEKDRIIAQRNLLVMQRDYWRGKYQRFTMTEVPEGFSRRQGADISVISRYARLYLKSIFPKVYIVKGIATSDFRKIWGIQDIYSRKERINHIHHCIDAVVIACIGKAEYDKLARYYHDEENHKWYGMSKASFKKPWPTFVEDIKRLQDDVLIVHNTPDNMHKQGRRRIKTGSARTLSKGDAARTSLHNDTYYGAINRDGEIKYVVRKSVDMLSESDVKNIVDDTVRAIFERAISRKGFKEAMAGTIWMNEEKRIPIKKVRCYTSIKNPIKIRRQRDESAKEYKRQFNVTNERNYMLAIYIGQDKKGKEKRDFEVVTALQAAEYYRASNDKEAVGHSIVPIKSSKGYPLAYTLKIGTMVLLYEKSPSELWEADGKEICKRLYKVVGLSTLTVSGNTYGIITMRYHQEARQSKEVKAKNGAYKKGEAHRAAILMLSTQINALVEGVDFKMNKAGEIEWIRTEKP